MRRSEDMDQEPLAKPTAPIQVLALLNRLSLNAFKSHSRQNLIFQILNDTLQLVAYDRAILWDMSRGDPSLLGISGQTIVNRASAIARNWRQVITHIKSQYTMQPLDQEAISQEAHDSWQALHHSTTSAPPSIYWIPIYSQDRLTMGLWLERWHEAPWTPEEVETLDFLGQAYGAAWEKFLPFVDLRGILRRRSSLMIGSIFVLSLLIHVPLRVVAPCEVIPKDPYVVTAPIEGTIEEVVVRPGEPVKTGQLLVNYDKTVPLKELMVAQKQVEVTDAQLHRAKSLAFDNAEALSQVATLSLDLKRDLLRLEIAEHQATLLEIAAPHDGIVMMDDPSQWRGSPVQIGEKIMVIADPRQTAVRIWIPESDNIPLRTSDPVKVILNTNPDKSYPMKVDYISTYAIPTDKGVMSFEGEVDWDKQPDHVKLGLKGTAVLYGNNVSLLYWVLRRPWSAIRTYMGW